MMGRGAARRPFRRGWPSQGGKSVEEQVKEEKTDAQTAASPRRGAAGVREDENHPRG